MTALDLALAPSRRSPLDGLFADAPAFARLGSFLALSLVVTLTAARIDPRPFQGESIWLKPIKFQLSLSLYLLTLAFFARYLPAGMRASRGWRIYALAVGLAVSAEMLWIAGAAALGTGSHFNVASPLMAALYPLMGVLAVLLTSASLVMGVAIGRNRHAGLAPALRLAVALGLGLTFVLTVPVAGYMAAGTSHLVGTPATGARLALLGWSGEVGDLRVAHFFAAHAMHILPVAGLLAARGLPDRAARTAVIVAAVLYVALVAATFGQAIAGQPFLAVRG